VTEHFNQLTPAEAERLALLSEECGEVIHIIGKILRHGLDSYHPKSGDINRILLEAELGDLTHAVARMCDAGDINPDTIEVFAEAKALRVGEYLHHQPDAVSNGSQKCIATDCLEGTCPTCTKLSPQPDTEGAE